MKSFKNQKVIQICDDCGNTISLTVMPNADKVEDILSMLRENWCSTYRAKEFAAMYHSKTSYRSRAEMVMLLQSKTPILLFCRKEWRSA